jgi:hypothetical protein
MIAQQSKNPDLWWFSHFCCWSKWSFVCVLIQFIHSQFLLAVWILQSSTKIKQNHKVSSFKCWTLKNIMSNVEKAKIFKIACPCWTFYWRTPFGPVLLLCLGVLPTPRSAAYGWCSDRRDCAAFKPVKHSSGYQGVKPLCWASSEKQQ